MQDYYLKAQEYCQVVNESNIKIEQGLLTLHGLEPPSDLADDAEIILVSGYEPSNPDSVKVVLDRPGKKILLILNSVEPITWHVEAKPTTKIAGILISPYKKSTVYTNTPTKAYASGLGIVLKLSDPGFTSLLTMLNGWFGVNKVDVFKGAYSLPPMISISEPDPSNFLLTLSGPPTQRPPTDFEFNLYTKDYKPVRWKLTKPLEDTKKIGIHEE
ncbi:MAG TPA: hypothetical protein VHO90_03870 [Bacteroidales bacterium]|nr:hypothetical protein [Bacteroidales bacterium]